MLLEITGTMVMMGVLGYTYLDKSAMTEGKKIQRIATNSGLKVTADGMTNTIHLLRRRTYSWGTEYIFRIPLGLSFDDFQKKKHLFEDGLSHKRGLIDITLNDIKTLKLNKDIVNQIKKLLITPKGRKEILFEYDGTLKIRVYNSPMPTMVPFDDETLKCKGWQMCIGQSREGIIYHDFDKIPHMVVAGTTRYGKSVFLKNAITTLIHTQSANVHFTLIDLKGGLAFNRFKNARQVDTVAKDVDESLEALKAIKKEMYQRQVSFLERGYEDIKEARLKQRKFIIIDEAAELASTGEPDKDEKKKKIECEKIIAEIARIGGGLGYRLIFATQYPTGDTLPRQVKQNCDARICFRIQTEVASQVVLDESGAEKLPFIQGRAIYRTDRKHMVQTPFIENEFIDRIVKPHITFKPRKENESGIVLAKENREGRGNTLVLEEVGLSQQQPNSKVTPIRRRPKHE